MTAEIRDEASERGWNLTLDLVLGKGTSSKSRFSSQGLKEKGDPNYVLELLWQFGEGVWEGKTEARRSMRLPQ